MQILICGSRLHITVVGKHGDFLYGRQVQAEGLSALLQSGVEIIAVIFLEQDAAIFNCAGVKVARNLGQQLRQSFRSKLKACFLIVHFAEKFYRQNKVQAGHSGDAVQQPCQLLAARLEVCGVDFFVDSACFLYCFKAVVGIGNNVAHRNKGQQQCIFAVGRMEAFFLQGCFEGLNIFVRHNSKAFCCNFRLLHFCADFFCQLVLFELAVGDAELTRCKN